MTPRWSASSTPTSLFMRREVGLIDFDDCGFGYRLYDIAVALWELRRAR